MTGLFFVTAILTGFVSFFVSSFFNCVLLFLIIFFASVILNIEILSLLKGIEGVNIFILTLLEFIVTLIFWLKKGKPFYKFNSITLYKKAFSEDKTFIVLGICWLFFIVTAFIISNVFPPTDPDAQTYHALRSLFWVSDGFISHFETADERMLCMPFNSEIFYSWLLCLNKNDSNFGLLQFFSYFLLIGSSNKIMEFFNIDLKKRLWAIFLFSSFPAVIIQISSTQTDLCIASLLSFSIYYVLKYTKEKNLSLLYFSALATSISYGVKTTSFMASIPVLVWFIFLLKKDFFKFFGFLGLNFLIFSSYAYILNLIDYNNPFASTAFINYNKIQGSIKNFISNTIKYLIQFLDFSGFSFAQNALDKIILPLREALLNFFKIPFGFGEIDLNVYKVNTALSETQGGFGPLGFILFLPGVILGFFSKKVRPFSAIFTASFIILLATMSYTIFGIRYITGFVALCFPVLCLTYFNKMNFLKFLSVLIMAYYMTYCAVFIHSKPLFYYTKLYKTEFGEMQNDIRNGALTPYSPLSFYEINALKEAMEPFCKDGNKIGFFASNSTALYGAKFLEINNNCKIETLNGLHINDYDLNKYKAIFVNSNMSQSIDSLNKNDIKAPLKSKRATCIYIPEKTPLKEVKFGICEVHRRYLDSLHFEFKEEKQYINTVGANMKIEIWERK